MRLQWKHFEVASTERATNQRKFRANAKRPIAKESWEGDMEGYVINCECSGFCLLTFGRVEELSMCGVSKSIFKKSFFSTNIATLFQPTKIPKKSMEPEIKDKRKRSKQISYK